MNAGRHDWQAFHKVRHSGQRLRLVREKQARSLEPRLANLETIFEIAMIVLVRFGVNDDCEINTGFIHTPKQMLGRRWRVGTIRRASMVGESSVVFSGKTMNVSVHDRGAVRRFVRARSKRHLGQGQRETCCDKEKTAPIDFRWRGHHARYFRFGERRVTGRIGNAGVHGLSHTLFAPTIKSTFYWMLDEGRAPAFSTAFL